MKFTVYIFLVSLLISSQFANSQNQFKASAKSGNFKNDVFILTEVSELNVSTTDSIFVKYVMYVAQDIGIEKWQEQIKPNYHGFGIKYLERDDIKIINKTYEGVKYRTVVLTEFILFPENKGVYSLPSYPMDIEISSPSKSGKDVFGRYILERHKIKIVTDKIGIKID